MTVTRQDVRRLPDVAVDLEHQTLEEYRRVIRQEEYWCCGAWRTKPALVEHALADLNLGNGHRSVDLPPGGGSGVR